jgi:hypothetical protein
MTPGEGRAAHVREIRNTLGLGLREAHDAFLRYGSAQLAIEALGTPAKRDEFESEHDRLRAECSRWHAEASALAASHQRLKEALGAVLCMLPSDHEDRPAEERIPASYCYVRWQDIREAREALRSAP